MESSKDLADAHPRIQAAFPLVRVDWQALHPDLDLRVDYTYRSPALQLELFKKGREQDEHGNWVLVDRAQRVTDKDGTKALSPHNYYPSHAADVYITDENGQILWPLPKTNAEAAARAALYAELGALWEKQGLISGATWKFAWKDEPHVEIAA